MQVKVFERDDGATVLLPVGLESELPASFDGRLDELGEASLDLGCLSPELVAALGLRGYCLARGADVIEVLRCLSAWRESPDRSVSIEGR
ncbi:hypothetical protein [Lysobacter humi (ex Lee et al. 2017)]